MAVGKVQVRDNGRKAVIENGWVGGEYAWVLLDDAHVMGLSNTTYGDVSADECQDADYSQLVISSKSVTLSSGRTYLKSNAANFGGTTTINGRYLVCVRGMAGSLQSSDLIVFIMDLKTEGGNLQSSNTKFEILQPTPGWAAV